MNCHEAQNHLFAASDGALETNERAALDAHIAQCAGCRRVRDDLVAAVSTWREESARAPLPNVDREWHAVRRRIRGGVDAGTAATFERPRRRLLLLPWLAVPVMAAAAVAITLYTASGPDSDDSAVKPEAPRPTQVARADSVDVPGQASTAVFVDDKSGWLVVWASDARQI